MTDTHPAASDTTAAARTNATTNPAATQPHPVQSLMHADPPLTARLEPWMEDLAADPARLSSLVETYDSPVNVLYPHVLPRNAAELMDAGAARDVDVRVFFARKANKGLSFVDAARDGGFGVDVASERELLQVLDRGVPAERMILSAAVKPERLLRVAVESGVPISSDNVAELRAIDGIAKELGRVAPVVPRIAPDPARLPATRFGERVDVWREALGEFPADAEAGVSIIGVHLHLHGYAAADRRVALAEALVLVDAITDTHHPVHFVDLGGGVPMSYLDSAEEWEEFHRRLRSQREGRAEEGAFTWKGDPLRNVYPFHQSPVRGEWLGEILDAPLPDVGDAAGVDAAAASAATSVDGPATPTVAEALRARGLRLHMEPGRSILDGGGVIVARVAFTKRRSDGVGLVGLEMNRTQCRTTADDILLDPLLVKAEPAAEATEEPADPPLTHGFLVGAYCIEDEVIVRRQMTFPHGITPGDFVVIPNTAGYFMHILESASHQIPLAKNVWMDPAGELHLDAIDNKEAKDNQLQ